MSITAMKLLVEALSMPCDRWNAVQTIKVNAALEAGRQAIEQAEKQEPVAWEELLKALRWIAEVNATDYEYQAKAREAIAKAEEA